MANIAIIAMTRGNTMLFQPPHKCCARARTCCTLHVSHFTFHRDADFAHFVQRDSSAELSGGILYFIIDTSRSRTLTTLACDVATATIEDTAG